jgi:hypothetical protein
MAVGFESRQRREESVRPYRARRTSRKRPAGPACGGVSHCLSGIISGHDSLLQLPLHTSLRHQKARISGSDAAEEGQKNEQHADHEMMSNAL